MERLNPSAAPFTPDTGRTLNADAPAFIPKSDVSLIQAQQPLRFEAAAGGASSVPLLGGFRMQREDRAATASPPPSSPSPAQHRINPESITAPLPKQWIGTPVNMAAHHQPATGQSDYGPRLNTPPSNNLKYYGTNTNSEPPMWQPQQQPQHPPMCGSHPTPRSQQQPTYFPPQPDYSPQHPANVGMFKSWSQMPAGPMSTLQWHPKHNPAPRPMGSSIPLRGSTMGRTGPGQMMESGPPAQSVQTVMPPAPRSAGGVTGRGYEGLAVLPAQQGNSPSSIVLPQPRSCSSPASHIAPPVTLQQEMRPPVPNFQMKWTPPHVRMQQQQQINKKTSRVATPPQPSSPSPTSPPANQAQEQPSGQAVPQSPQQVRTQASQRWTLTTPPAEHTAPSPASSPTPHTWKPPHHGSLQNSATPSTCSTATTLASRPKVWLPTHTHHFAHHRPAAVPNGQSGTPTPVVLGAAAAPSEPADVNTTAQKPTTDAPSYLPKNWNPAPSLSKPSPENPLVLLLYGCRGSGKTTQGKLLAERYNLLYLSSGSIVKDGKHPFKELRRIVTEEFGPTAPKRYNGIVLDRFIVCSEVDAYYIQSALGDGNLPVPLAFWLQIDRHVGMERAESRGDQKTSLEYWRFVEQTAQTTVTEQVYHLCNSVTSIPIEGLGELDVFRKICEVVDAQFPLRTRGYVRLPPYTPVPKDFSCTLFCRYEDFIELARQVHEAIGNTAGRIDSAPLSSIGGYVDSSSFAYSRRSIMATMYVTPKVDGERYLVAKHKQWGFVGFPFHFKCCFDFNRLFLGLPVETPSKETCVNDVEYLLDTELVVREGCTPSLHIIDYVYFYGDVAKREKFSMRYMKLKKWFAPAMTHSPRQVHLKEYVPIYDLDKLLPHFPPVETSDDGGSGIDGVVFQHNDTYRYGSDRHLLKWKPQALCTADFRLMNCVASSREEMRCDLYVSDLGNCKGLTEGKFPGAMGVFTTMETRRYRLNDSIVVELASKFIGPADPTTKERKTLWSFHRLRPDKQSPNKLSVVKEMIEMSHLTFTDLLKLCRDLRL